MAFDEFGLEVEKVQMACGTCHEKLNDPFGFRRFLRSKGT
jgi:hypothetical protein